MGRNTPGATLALVFVVSAPLRHHGGSNSETLMNAPDYVLNSPTVGRKFLLFDTGRSMSTVNEAAWQQGRGINT